MCQERRHGQIQLGVVCQNSIPTLDDVRAACEPWRAMSLVLALLGALRAALRTRTDLTLENLALRQQLALLRRRSKRPQIRAPRSPPLGVALQPVGWVARGAPPRSPRDRDSLAPAGPRFLDLEVPSQASGSTTGRLGACGSRAHHGAGEPALGRATHSRRAAQARFR